MNSYIIDSQEDIGYLVNSDSIIYIEVDIALSSDLTLGANTILVFKNGAKFSAATEKTITGNNTTIDAPLAQIFGENIHISGSFVNAEWPVEWWGARNDGMVTGNGNDTFTGAEAAINRALVELSNTSRQSTLLLTNIYAVCDTIYMQPGVALSGAARTYAYNFYEGTGSSKSRPTRGTLLVKFNDTNKWVIDMKDRNGNALQYNKLNADDSDYNQHFGSQNVGCNISSLCIKDKSKTNYTHVFGGIRLHSMQSGKIENVDIDAHAFIGLALMATMWNVELNNLHINVVGCSLYIGKSCTTITAINVSCRSTNSKHPGPFRLTQPTTTSTFVTPLLQEHSLPPYLSRTYVTDNDNHYHMQSCGIIMEGAHCTFYSCAIELADAVICGTNYIAKFITPYIENIYYTFGWLFATQEYSIPSHRYELIVEDMISGFNTFPSLALQDNIPAYLKWNQNTEKARTADDPEVEGDDRILIDPENEELEEFHYLPTFGTVRGVIKAHNVGRATCWENMADEDDRIEEENQLVTWNYPSYYIYVNPGGIQYHFYYDKYLLCQVKNNNDLVPKGESRLYDLHYCKYKEIIIEGSSMKSIQYYYHDGDIGNVVNTMTTDQKKRQLYVGLMRNTATQSGELFVRNLDNFIMTPVYYNSPVDYGKMIIGKTFTFEIVNGARSIILKKPLWLHDCNVTFKNSNQQAPLIFTTPSTNDEGHLKITGNCTLNFEGNIILYNRLLDKFIVFYGDAPIHVTINLWYTNTIVPPPSSYENLNDVININNAFYSPINFAHGATITINKFQKDINENILLSQDVIQIPIT